MDKEKLIEYLKKRIEDCNKKQYCYDTWELGKNKGYEEAFEEILEGITDGDFNKNKEEEGE